MAQTHAEAIADALRERFASHPDRAKWLVMASYDEIAELAASILAPPLETDPCWCPHGNRLGLSFACRWCDRGLHPDWWGGTENRPFDAQVEA